MSLYVIPGATACGNHRCCRFQSQYYPLSSDLQNPPEKLTQLICMLKISWKMYLEGQNGSVNCILQLQVLRVPGKWKMGFFRVPVKGYFEVKQYLDVNWCIPSPGYFFICFNFHHIPFLQESLAIDTVLAHRSCLPSKVGTAWVALKIWHSDNKHQQVLQPKQVRYRETSNL